MPMMTMAGKRPAAVLLAVLAVAVPAATAQTRASQIESARDAKSAALRPESVSRIEAVMLEVKQRKLLERLTAGYNGIRVKLGSMATGSGFAFGPEIVREELAGGSLRLDASALFSTGLWQKYQAGIAIDRKSVV